MMHYAKEVLLRKFVSQKRAVEAVKIIILDTAIFLLYDKITVHFRMDIYYEWKW